MAHPQLTRDLLSDPDEDRSRSGESESEAEATGPQSAQERKREALYLPISSICAALGGQEEFKDKDGNIYKEYSLGDQVIGCLKDLKRFWRMDEKDDDRTVARIFYDVGVLERDLIPILFTTLGTSPKGDRIALACVELIGAMTWPINVAEELRDAQLLDELTKSIDYNSLINHQLAYKAAILRTGALKPMFQLMSPALAKSRRDRTPKDENIISLVLHTFRNLAALKDKVTASTSASALELASLQSDLIVQLAAEHIFDLLIAIAYNADSTEYAPWNMVALDIFHLIFRSVKPADLMVPSRKLEDNRLQELLDLEEKNRPVVVRANNSRHSRFGTTVALKANDRQYILHKQSALSAGAEKTMDQIKKARAVKARQDDDLQPPANLRPDALRKLYAVGISFLDSAFNPFFSSVLKDIRMERLKVKESDTIRYLFLARFFLEFFLLVQQDEKKRGVDPTSEDGHDFDVVAELVEPMAIAFVTTKMKGALEEKPPLWIELHAGVDCFTQILLVIEAMSLSGREEHVDTAEILQNKLYYDADTLELCASLLRRYDHQSNKFLDAIVHLAYVMLRMLEKYSKSKAYMFVRRKKANRGGAAKKKKAVEDEEGDGIGQGADEEEEEAERGVPSFKEHQFEMEKFEDKFVDEAILQTYMVYLSQYSNFTSPNQMKRIVNLMHRIAIKSKCEALFFKPTVLDLFQTIIDDRTVSNNKDTVYHDLVRLIDFVLKRFFKVAKEYPMLLLEIFFPKSTNQLTKHRDLAVQGGALASNPYASSDEDGLPAVLAAKGLAEVEVTPGFSLTQQIGIAMRCLTDAGQESLVECVQRNLRLAAALRTDVVLAVDGEIEAQEGEDDGTDEALRRKALRLGGPSDEAKEKFEPIRVVFSTDYLKEQSTTNQHFRLLMRLLTWVSSAPNPDQPTELEWHIPVTAMPKQLEGDLNIIDGFLLDPVDPNNGKSAADLLRKKRKPVARRRRARLATSELEELGDASDEEEEVVGEDGEVVRVRKEGRRPRAKATRKRKPAGSGEGGGKGGGSGERRKARARKEKEAEAYRSAQFIEDSDFDEDADRLFFEREAAFRAAVDGGAVKPGGMEGTKSGKLSTPAKGKRKAKGRGAKQAPAGSDEEEASDAPPSDVEMASDAESDPDAETDSDADEPSAVSSGDEGGRKRGRVGSASATGGSSALPVGPRKALFNPTTQDSAGQEESEDEIDRAMRGTAAKKRRVVVADSDEE